MKVLVIDPAEEKMFCWSFAKSPKIKIYCAPGNGGIAKIVEIVILP